MDICYLNLEEYKENEYSLELYFILLSCSLLVLRLTYIYISNFGKYYYETVRYNGDDRLLRMNFSTGYLKKNVYLYEFEDFGKFSRLKIRDEVLRIMSEIDILRDYDEKREFLIKQRFVKPKDYFEVYSFLVLKGYSFEINIFDDLRYNIEFFNVLNVLKNGPHINLKNFNWEMSFDDNEKIIKTQYFTLGIYSRENIIENDIINIRYDVKILDNPYEINDKYLYYMVQII